jgi:MYXO-CTERM domain-containing protein
MSLLRLLSIHVLASAILLTGEAWAAPITKTATVKVHQVCDDSGANCASKGPAGNFYFANETSKIWSQAGISIGFDFAGTINSTLYSNIDDTLLGHTFADLHQQYGSGPGSIDMFLVQTINGAYGEAWLGQGGLVIAMSSVMAYNGGIGRLDTIAHELGHNFGLDHSADNHPDYLMATGAVRFVPGSLADINPTGLKYDKIPIAQQNTARSSFLLQDVVSTPEPTSLLLAAGGLIALAAIRRRGRGVCGA